ncbi:Non-homologous end-joining factor 1 [Trichoplax sp. H2]|uniref:Non-homologous end-joining factor 1 n=1 Tax=Trichoplax adhaerens TaxID=10228 RepID=B3RQ81_TRIAD|nr:hypothetical protein TRIADDRAFT_53808 [Trichoplax adhaerens]EDV28306.1 hypothetical protein TRIADDRAFT_53808 [Trichoplax adhaerens]RDD45612.1 Non-homologous end-joining factor 1 [Trichoplax sp. H2]|eukprot:XP_002110140.1 hypothetical protein TRIADDRAFT_53808 [Trichoplax adhaerens]
MAAEMEWRRNRQGDLNSQSWHPFEINSKVYLIKSYFSEEDYEVCLYDPNYGLWSERLDQMDIRKRCKVLNPNVEAPLHQILKHISKSIEIQKPDINYSLEFQDNQEGDQMVMFSFSTLLAGLPFNWTFHCELAHLQELDLHLIQPLWMMISELLRRQEELKKIIVNKDREIDDYKSTGARCSRKQLETSKFDEKSFTNEMITSKDFEDQIRTGTSKFVATKVSELYKQLMIKKTWLQVRDSYNFDQAFENSLYDMSGTQRESAAVTGGAGSWLNKLPPSLMPNESISPEKKSPIKKQKATISPQVTPQKEENAELKRRLELEQKLAKNAEKVAAKKKKKLKF